MEPTDDPEWRPTLRTNSPVDQSDSGPEMWNDSYTFPVMRTYIPVDQSDPEPDMWNDYYAPDDRFIPSLLSIVNGATPHIRPRSVSPEAVIIGSRSRSVSPQTVIIGSRSRSISSSSAVSDSEAYYSDRSRTPSPTDYHGNFVYQTPNAYYPIQPRTPSPSNNYRWLSYQGRDSRAHHSYQARSPSPPNDPHNSYRPLSPNLSPTIYSESDDDDDYVEYDEDDYMYYRPSLLTRVKAYFKESPWHWVWVVPVCITTLVFLSLLIVHLASPNKLFNGYKARDWMWLITLIVFAGSFLLSMVFWLLRGVGIYVRDWWHRQLIASYRRTKVRNGIADDDDLEGLFDDEYEEEEELDGDEFLEGRGGY